MKEEGLPVLGGCDFLRFSSEYIQAGSPNELTCLPENGGGILATRGFRRWSNQTKTKSLHSPSCPIQLETSFLWCIMLGIPQSYSSAPRGKVRPFPPPLPAQLQCSTGASPHASHRRVSNVYLFPTSVSTYARRSTQAHRKDLLSGHFG